MASIIADTNFDARIIQTVRNLKKQPSRQSDETKSDSDNSKNMIIEDKQKTNK
jgi:hypothetical protein